MKFLQKNLLSLIINDKKTEVYEADNKKLEDILDRYSSKTYLKKIKYPFCHL